MNEDQMCLGTPCPLVADYPPYLHPYSPMGHHTGAFGNRNGYFGARPGSRHFTQTDWASDIHRVKNMTLSTLKMSEANQTILERLVSVFSYTNIIVYLGDRCKRGGSNRKV